MSSNAYSVRLITALFWREHAFTLIFIMRSVATDILLQDTFHNSYALQWLPLTMTHFTAGLIRVLMNNTKKWIDHWAIEHEREFVSANDIYDSAQVNFSSTMDVICKLEHISNLRSLSNDQSCRFSIELSNCSLLVLNSYFETRHQCRLDCIACRYCILYNVYRIPRVYYSTNVYVLCTTLCTVYCVRTPPHNQSLVGLFSSFSRWWLDTVINPAPAMKFALKKIALFASITRSMSMQVTRSDGQVTYEESNIFSSLK